MLRKFGLVAAAAASLAAAAALAPTSASAWGGYGWHRGWHGGHWGGPRVFVGGPAYGYQPLLLTAIVRSGRQKGPGPSRPGPYYWRSKMEPPAAFHAIFTGTHAIRQRDETISGPTNWFCITTLK